VKKAQGFALDPPKAKPLESNLQEKGAGANGPKSMA
jgi:hypothetical protein